MQCKDSARGKILSKVTGEIGSLTSSAEVAVQKPGEGAPPGCAPAVIDDSTIVQLLLAGILDPQKEIEKLQKEKVLQSSSGSVCVCLCVCAVCVCKCFKAVALCFCLCFFSWTSPLMPSCFPSIASLGADNKHYCCAVASTECLQVRRWVRCMTKLRCVMLFR